MFLLLSKLTPTWAARNRLIFFTTNLNPFCFQNPNVLTPRVSYISLRFAKTELEVHKPWQNKILTPGIYLLKVNNRSIKRRCEICSKLTVKTPERRHWRRSRVFINFVHFSHLALVFLVKINCRLGYLLWGLLGTSNIHAKGFWQCHTRLRIKLGTMLKKTEISSLTTSTCSRN